MARLLLLFGLLFLLFKSMLWFLRLLHKYKAIQGFFHNKKNNQQQTEFITNMVQCNNCGIYLPQDKAIMHNAEYFCCYDHIENR